MNKNTAVFPYAGSGMLDPTGKTQELLAEDPFLKRVLTQEQLLSGPQPNPNQATPESPK